MKNCTICHKPVAIGEKFCYAHKEGNRETYTAGRGWGSWTGIAHLSCARKKTGKRISTARE